jgi:hypothetical protein
MCDVSVTTEPRADTTVTRLPKQATVTVQPWTTISTVVMPPLCPVKWHLHRKLEATCKHRVLLRAMPPTHTHLTVKYQVSYIMSKWYIASLGGGR